MRFSFVIPTYNNRILLKNTLEALNYQEGFGPEDYEVIIADDGSSDLTQEFIQGVNTNYTFQYLYLERCNQSSRARTRNAGWKKATGEIVVFIDSDILVQKNYLQELDRCFRLNRPMIVLGSRLMLSQPVRFEDISTGNVFLNHPFQPEHYEMLESRFYHFEKASYNTNAMLCPWLIVYSCNLAVPKVWLERTGGFDENYKGWGLEDLDLGYALYSQGLVIINNSKLEVLHQFHGKANDFAIEQNQILGYEKNIDYFIEKFPRALNLSNQKAYKFLKGQFSMDIINMNPLVEIREIHFKKHQELEKLKNTILELTKNPNVKAILYDYVENTDLDVWIQLLGRTRSTVKYYPMSRRINAKAMKETMNQIRAQKTEVSI